MKSYLARASVLLAVLFLGLAGSAQAESDLDFKLVNKTGYTLNEVFIGPSTSEEWGDNILDAKLPDGASASITFNPEAKAPKWDILVVYEDGTKVQWIGYKLDEISKITLFYDADKDVTSAKTE